MSATWIRKLIDKFKDTPRSPRRPGKGRHPRGSRPVLERLEDRLSPSVTVTAASGGTGISADKAVGATATAFTNLGPITISEGAANDFQTGVGLQHLRLNAPTGWQ